MNTNMNRLKQLESSKLIVLKEEQVLFGGLSLYYRFTVESRFGEPRFGVVVELGEENAAGELGNHLGRAWELYALIVKGAVTPCSLYDVLSDFTVAG